MQYDVGISAENDIVFTVAAKYGCALIASVAMGDLSNTLILLSHEVNLSPRYGVTR